MLDLVNLQKQIKLDLASYRAFMKIAAKAVEESDGRPFSIAFIDDERMRSLNEQFRGKASTTDVLSFPNGPDDFELTTDRRPLTIVPLGDIAISAQQAAKQAADNDLSLETEIKQLILHGLLHLCGYDHETDNGEMNTRELALRHDLGI